MRNPIRSMLIVALGFLLMQGTGGAETATSHSPATASSAASGPGADAVLEALLAGNKRFVDGKRTYPNLGNTRRTDLFSQGQKPVVTILSCSDSRVPPEHIFDAGLGDLFVVRVAGNVADTDEIGTVEYGTEHLGTPLVMVLGHSKCGAVTAVFKGDEVGGAIPRLVDNIIPAVNAVKASAGADFSDASLDLAIKANVRQSVHDLLAHSVIVRELVEAGKVRVVGALYHLDSGEVEMLEVGGVESVPLASAGPAEVSPVAKAVGGSGDAEASAVQNPFLALLPSLAAALLALVVWMVLFLGKTRLKRIKFKTRLVTGVVAYLFLAVVPACLALANPNGTQPLALAGTLSSMILVMVIAVISMLALSNHLARIYQGLKESRYQYKGTEHE